jgi:plastocyanin
MLFTFTTFAALVSLAAIPPTRAAQINVVVGGPGGVIAYNPSSVNANPGDVVVFEFQQKNHTATQSTLANPCTPMPGGFNSGFIPVDATNTAGPFPQAQFTVQDTNPVWVFCQQTGHCQQGMVFAINPGTQFSQFQAAANSSGSAAASGSPYGSPTASAATPSGTTTDHKVVVGGSAGLVYTPSNITAQAGDTVTFEFQTKNHTVTQSTFADPCRALTLTSTSGQVGFDSGFMPVAANATTFPSYTVQVNDTSPVWVYCKQTGHCGQGMVFSVNANESSPNSFEAFQAKAKQLNGSSSTSSSSGAPSPSSSSGASSSKLISGASIAAALIAIGFGFLS